MFSKKIKRQLIKNFGEEYVETFMGEIINENLPQNKFDENLSKFIKSIESSYDQYESRLRHAGTSIENSTNELFERNYQLRAETKKIKDLLDNMQQAVFQVTNDGNIVGPVSFHAEKVFGMKIVGLNVFESIYKSISTQSELSTAIKSVFCLAFGEGPLQWILVRNDLPRRITYIKDGSDEGPTLKINYAPIWDENDCLEKIMFVVEDITELEKLEKQVSEERNRNKRKTEIILQLAANDIDALGYFFENIPKMIDECVHIVENDDEKFLSILDSLHTIKGNARLMQFHNISSLVHNIEGVFKEDLKHFETGGIKKNTLLEKVKLGIDEITAQVNEYAVLSKNIFGTKNPLESKLVSEAWNEFKKVESGVYNIIGRNYTELLSKGKIEGGEDVQERIKIFNTLLLDFRKACFLVGDNRIVEEIDELIDSLKKLPNFNELKENIIKKFVSIGKRIKNIYWNSNLYTLYPAEINDWSKVLSKGLEILNALQYEKISKKQFVSSIAKKIYYLRIEAENNGLIYLSQYFEIVDTTLRTHYLEKENPYLKDIISNLYFSYCQYLIIISLIQVSSYTDKASLKGLLKELNSIFKTRRDIESKISALAKRYPVIILHIMGKSFKSGILPEMFIADMEKILKETGKSNIFEYILLDNSENLKDITQFVKESSPFFEFNKESKVKNNQGLVKSWYQRDEAPRGVNKLDKGMDLLHIIDAFNEKSRREFGRKNFRYYEVPEDRLKKFEEKLRAQVSKNSNLKSLLESYDQLFAVSLTDLCFKFTTMIEEISQKEGKEVELHVEGNDIYISKEIARTLHDSLLHILRNCVDHGIESPNRRKLKGKSIKGNISINIRKAGKSIFIDISDDGQGIDIEKIKEKARNIGIYTNKKLENMSEEKILDLVFVPNLSSKETVDEVSGRGLGMNIVRELIEKINGTIKVEKIDVGSKFKIKL